ncbi:MAG: LamG domain-containing protein, partial [Planctomycetes bacterium]|nr:LamG domain-containing protein [Planctomycetota bacterium]
SPMLGLKSSEATRLDLSGGKLVAGQWHRVTGVFDRPKASLYLDGQLVAQRDWDHECDPGGQLCIGAKAGSTYFFKGKLDELRIYNYPRPPLPTDKPSTELVQVGAAKPTEVKMDVRESADGVSVDTGAIRFELGRNGALRSLAVGDKPVVSKNTAPFFAASLFESAAYDGWRDHAPGKVVDGTYRPTSHKFTHSQPPAGSKPAGGWFTAQFDGRLDFPGGDRIECAMTLEAKAGSPFLTVTARLTPSGTFKDRFLRSASLRLPLALNKRKRVVQAGDRGVQWNTRHWYQFHTTTTMGLLSEPDHNIWRTFAIDQNTSGDYHLWRSESAATSALTMQRGLRAPGWMAAYDQRAGVLFAYRGLAERTPKSLRVEADGAGEARVCLWHEGLPALDLKSPQAPAVFGEPHVTDWMAFGDEFPHVQPDLALAQHWGVKTLASDPPARNEVPCADLNLLDAPTADSEAPLVSGGVPFPKGALANPQHVRLRRDGADVPLQTRVLGFWPDKSTKWLLLTFPADKAESSGGSGEGTALNFDLTRRDGTKSAYRLDYGPNVKMGATQAPLRATQNGDFININTGPLQLELTKAAGWLKSAKLAGKEMLGAGGGCSFVDFLRNDGRYPTNSTLAQGSLDDGGFAPEQMDLEEAGPLRAVVRLEGYAKSQEPTRVIVRLEAYAGRSVVRVFQSVEFLHKDPRVAFVRRMGLELPLASTDGATVSVG